MNPSGTTCSGHLEVGETSTNSLSSFYANSSAPIETSSPVIGAGVFAKLEIVSNDSQINYQSMNTASSCNRNMSCINRDNKATTSCLLVQDGSQNQIIALTQISAVRRETWER